MSSLNEKGKVVNFVHPNRTKHATLKYLGIFGLGNIGNPQCAAAILLFRGHSTKETKLSSKLKL